MKEGREIAILNSLSFLPTCFMGHVKKNLFFEMKVQD